MTKTDIFLDKYKQLEVAVRNAYKLDRYASAISFLKKNKAYEEYRPELEFCADIRNLLSHNPKLNGEYALEPSDKIIEFLDSMIEKVKKCQKCRDIAIKFRNVCHFTSSGKVADAISVMNSKHISHVPIVGNHRVIGVFDEVSLFSLIAEKGASFIADNPDLTFRDIPEYITLADRGSKKFIFIPASMRVDELDELCEKYHSERKRIGFIFVTQNGKETEPLIGVLTPWEIVAAR